MTKTGELAILLNKCLVPRRLNERTSCAKVKRLNSKGRPNLTQWYKLQHLRR